MKGLIAHAAAALLGLVPPILHSEAKAVLPASQAPGPEQQQLRAGAEKLKQGYSALAIRDFFDPVIAHYEKAYAHSNKEVHTARSPAESLLYLVGDVAARGGGRRGRDATPGISRSSRIPTRTRRTSGRRWRSTARPRMPPSSRRPRMRSRRTLRWR